jgi:hypothetical protein
MKEVHPEMVGEFSRSCNGDSAAAVATLKKPDPCGPGFGELSNSIQKQTKQTNLVDSTQTVEASP